MFVTRNPRGHVLYIISGLFARRRFSARQPLSSNRIPERSGCLPATNVCELNIYRDNADIPISPSVFACTHSLRISLSIDPHYAIIGIFLSHPMREAHRGLLTRITRFVSIYFRAARAHFEMCLHHFIIAIYSWRVLKRYLPFLYFEIKTISVLTYFRGM